MTRGAVVSYGSMSLSIGDLLHPSMVVPKEICWESALTSNPITLGCQSDVWLDPATIAGINNIYYMADWDIHIMLTLFP